MFNRPYLTSVDIFYSSVACKMSTKDNRMIQEMCKLKMISIAVYLQRTVVQVLEKNL